MILIMDPAPRIALRDVSVMRGDHIALSGVTVAFAPGTATALVGPNGSGKTTMLEVLAGLRSPTSGLVHGDGSTVALVPQRHTRSWMPLTVSEVLRMARFRPTVVPRRLGAHDHAAVDGAAGRLGVRALLDRPLDQLSFGQRQRVLVAQALAREADVLLLDEPITGLDLLSQERILTVIEEERHDGRTVVLTTHHLDEARHCDEVVVLDGRRATRRRPGASRAPGGLRRTRPR